MNINLLYTIFAVLLLIGCQNKSSNNNEIDILNSKLHSLIDEKMHYTNSIELLNKNIINFKYINNNTKYYLSAEVHNIELLNKVENRIFSGGILGEFRMREHYGKKLPILDYVSSLASEVSAISENMQNNINSSISPEFNEIRIDDIHLNQINNIDENIDHKQNINDNDDILKEINDLNELYKSNNNLMFLEKYYNLEKKFNLLEYEKNSILMDKFINIKNSFFYNGYFIAKGYPVLLTSLSDKIDISSKIRLKIMNRIFNKSILLSKFDFYKTIILLSLIKNYDYKLIYKYKDINFLLNNASNILNENKIFEGVRSLNINDSLTENILTVFMASIKNFNTADLDTVKNIINNMN